MSGEALFQVNRISRCASLDLRFATEFLESPFNTFFLKEVVSQFCQFCTQEATSHQDSF